MKRECIQRSINAEAVNDRAKLLAHRLVARRLSSDPGIVERARQILSDQRAQGRDYAFIGEWERLLDLGPERLRRLITERSETMTRLRISSPLGLASGLFIEDEALRRRIRRKAKDGLIRAAARREALAGSQQIYPPSERDIEKQRARERDAERLRNGEASLQDLMREDPFAGIPMETFRIVRIGHRPVGRSNGTIDGGNDDKAR